MFARELGPSRAGLVKFGPCPGSSPRDWSIPLPGRVQGPPANVVTQRETCW